MIPVQQFVDDLANLIAGDAGWLGDVTGVNPLQLWLVTSDFTPSPSLALADLTLIDDTTYTWAVGKEVEEGTQTVVADSGSNTRGIFLKEPVGGFTWVADSAPTPPVTVTGYCLVRTNGAGGPPTQLIASELFGEPFTFASYADYKEVTARFGFMAFIPIS